MSQSTALLMCPFIVVDVRCQFEDGRRFEWASVLQWGEFGIQFREFLAMKNTIHQSVKLLVLGCGFGAMMTMGMEMSRASVLAPFPLLLGVNSAIPPNPDCPIKGNISHNSGFHYYHLPGMPDYEITLIDVTRGERWFCSEAEAIAAGWTKAPIRPHHNR